MTFMNGLGEGFRGLLQTLLFPNILSSGCQERGAGRAANMFKKGFSGDKAKLGFEKEKDTILLSSKGLAACYYF